MTSGNSINCEWIYNYICKLASALAITALACSSHLHVKCDVCKELAAIKNAISAKPPNIAFDSPSTTPSFNDMTTSFTTHPAITTALKELRYKIGSYWDCPEGIMTYDELKNIDLKTYLNTNERIKKLSEDYSKVDANSDIVFVHPLHQPSVLHQESVRRRNPVDARAVLQ